MRTKLEDLISTCPQQLEANTIIVYDGCNWILQQIPDGITCGDVLSCIDCEALLNIIGFNTGLIVDPSRCSVSVDADYIVSLFSASIECTTGILTIGNTTVDLTCLANFFTFGFNDGLNSDFITNGETIFLQGIDGLRFIVGPNLIQVGLPTGANNGEVLTWNTATNSAVRSSISDLQCNVIQGCMQFIVDALQNQIDNIGTTFQSQIDGVQNQIDVLASQICPCGGPRPVVVLTGWLCPEGEILSTEVGSFYVLVNPSHSDDGALYYNPTANTTTGRRMVQSSPAICS